MLNHLIPILSICLSIDNAAYSVTSTGFEEVLTILQGEIAQYAPWQVRLLSDVRNEDSGYCGGTLIDNSHVLTALHCVCSDSNLEFSPSDTLNCTNIRSHVAVVLGDNIISEEEGSEVFAICSQIFLHPRGFDLAICELDRNISSTPAIQPIKLPLEEPPIGATVKATGWGSIDASIKNAMTDKLHEVALRLANICPFAHELCAEGMDRFSQFYQGLWKGDSGGPLVIDASNTWYLVGVASAVELGQNASASYSKFVNVYKQREWILSITARNDTCPESGILCESPEAFLSFQKTKSLQRCAIQPWLCDHVTDCANGEDETDTVCKNRALLLRSSMSLFDAARQGQNELVLNMLDAGMDVNSRDMYNHTALHYAAQYNQHVLVLQLLLYKADITARTLDGNTALMLATWANSRETALELIRYDNDVNAGNKDNATALFGVAMRGDVQVADALIGKGALPNIMDIYGNTPLLLAASNCDLEMMRFLLSRNSDANFGSIVLPLHAVLNADCVSKQDTALDLLLKYGANADAPNDLTDGVALFKPLEMAVLRNDSEMVRALLNHGADPNAVTLYDLTFWRSKNINSFFQQLTDNLYHYRHQSKKSESKDNDQSIIEEVIPRLLDDFVDDMSRVIYVSLMARLGLYSFNAQHLNIAMPEIIAFSPLAHACERGETDIVRLLLQFGANTSAQNELGLTDLHIASWQCDVDILRLLFDYGSQINCRDIFNQTELHYAAKSNCTNAGVLQFLLQNHADVNAKDFLGMTPLMNAVEGSNINSVRKVLEFHADVHVRDIYGWTALHLAALRCNVEIVVLLLDRGININLYNNMNETVLHAAASSDCTRADVLLYLLKHNVDVNAQDVDGYTPLMWTALKSNLDATLKLLQFHADVNVKDIDGWTALHHAAAQCNVNIVEAFLDREIDINIRTFNNQTALHIATSHNCTHADVLLYLLEHDADVNAQDDKGLTPLMWTAVEKNLDATLKLLQFHADVNVRDIIGWTALHYAAAQCNVGIKVLLDFNNQTAPHAAASRNCPLADVLLRHVEDINT